MEKPLAPEVRTEFAKRLREMRLQSGFPRARYFAKSLGIEENRYTRYERAEVEPSLTLIHKMCETLGVSPNELLGFAEYAGSSVSGFAEGAPYESASVEDVDPQRWAQILRLTSVAEDADARRSDLLAWRLASEAVLVRHKLRASAKAPSDPLAATRATANLYQKLLSDPFGTVAEIVGDDALKDLDSERKAGLADLIEAYTESLSRAASGKLRR